MRQILEQRFWSHVERPKNWQGEGAFHCWHWKGSLNRGGYGSFQTNHKLATTDNEAEKILSD